MELIKRPRRLRGSEAVRRLCVRDMPLTVVIDSRGENLYESGPAAYLSSL